MHQEELDKLNRIRAALADKNQKISKIQREIEDIPTRVRFVRLFC